MTGMNLKREIDQIAKDKGIDIDEIIGALEEARGGTGSASEAS